MAIPTVRTRATGRHEVAARAERLSAASLRRVVDPDLDLPGRVGRGRLLPDELLSVAGLDLGLTEQQRVALGREEVAAIMDAGVRFEAVLMAGFAMTVLRHEDLGDPRVTYMLHEVGEETRHSRAFVRVVGQVAPKARNPLMGRAVQALDRATLPILLNLPAFFVVMVLSGEEIPDLFQKLASEHPDTDPHLAEVARYHRMEEARHLGFARAVLPELWREAGPVQRFLVRRVAPAAITSLFTTIVHPGVYAVVGLPRWSTWRAVNRTPQRLDLKHRALRPVLETLVEAGVVRRGRIPGGWRRLCGVDRRGTPVPRAG